MHRFAAVLFAVMLVGIPSRYTMKVAGMHDGAGCQVDKQSDEKGLLYLRRQRSKAKMECDTGSGQSTKLCQVVCFAEFHDLGFHFSCLQVVLPGAACMWCGGFV